ncbi:MAG TPA: hypothetical protein GXZ87_03820 [Bacteroidales bacterium]|nr:hypothetical protein [Bacteroidales bacterium]
MNRIIFILALVLCYNSLAFSQAKKPTIMVVPSTTWCYDNDCVITYENYGEEDFVPNFRKALLNSDLKLAIVKLGELMADRGFPLKDLEQTTKSINQKAIEDRAIQSKASGSSVAVSTYEEIINRAKADIIMELTYTVKQSGPRKTISYILAGKDPYTNKQIAAASGTGAPSFSADVVVLLEEAVLNYMDGFTSQLQNYFDDLFENGRETGVTIKRFANWNKDLESEFGGKELSEIIEEWMEANTVKGRFSLSDATENLMVFEQVRIPLYDEKESAMDTRKFVRNLQKYLKTTYSIDSKLVTKGLGEAQLILGEK